VKVYRPDQSPNHSEQWRYFVFQRHVSSYRHRAFQFATVAWNLISYDEQTILLREFKISDDDHALQQIQMKDGDVFLHRIRDYFFPSGKRWWFGEHRPILSSIGQLMEKYHISQSEAELLICLRDGEGAWCDICGKNRDIVKRFVIDHDHETNQVRGILCHRCNSALGFLENGFPLERGYAYLSGAKI